MVPCQSRKIPILRPGLRLPQCISQMESFKILATLCGRLCVSGSVSCIAYLPQLFVYGDILLPSTPGQHGHQVEKDMQLSYSIEVLENGFPWTWLFKGQLLSLGSLRIIALSLYHPRLQGTEFEYTFLQWSEYSISSLSPESGPIMDRIQQDPSLLALLQGSPSSRFTLLFSNWDPIIHSGQKSVQVRNLTLLG